jgi:hypothetical protein
MPAGGVMAPVAGLGSGKFGTPWARMQRDTARSFWISWGLTCGGDVAGGPWYFAQARCAAWNIGEEASEATLWEIWPLKALMAPDAPREAGSGKLETPCERMHLAYSTSAPPEDGPPVAAAVVGTAVVGTAVVGAAVVVVLRLATPAVGEPPPQAAVATARLIITGATRYSRQAFIGFALRDHRVGHQDDADTAGAYTLRVYSVSIVLSPHSRSAEKFAGQGLSSPGALKRCRRVGHA